jgi:hypothetical protein
MADNNLQAPAVAAKKPQGAGYTRTEDYFVCKAFIASSDDPFIGRTGYPFPQDYEVSCHRKANSTRFGFQFRTISSEVQANL